MELIKKRESILGMVGGICLAGLIGVMWWDSGRSLNAGVQGRVLCHFEKRRLHGFAKASAVADRTSLQQMFEKQHYQPPQGTHLMATRVIRGVQQPAFLYYSLGNTGFVHSRGHFWPASAVKVWAAVGALMTLHARGLDLRTELMFSDVYGNFRGNVVRLFYPLHNKHYDQMMRLAGLDEINEPRRRMRYGLPNLVLLCPYAKGANIKDSPEILYRRGKRRGVIPARHARRLRYPGCPPQYNCTTLFELQDVLRRIVLHDELPASVRFPVPSADMLALRKALRKRVGKHKLWQAVKHTLDEHRTLVYGKSGSSRGASQLDNLFFDAPQGRFLVTPLVRWYRHEPEAGPSMLVLDELGKHTLQALLRMPTEGVPVQADAGVSMDTQFQAIPQQPYVYQIQVLAPGVESLKAWVNRRVVSFHRIKEGEFQSTYSFEKSGEYVWVFQGEKRGEPVSYRSFGTYIPPVNSRCSRGG